MTEVINLRIFFTLFSYILDIFHAFDMSTKQRFVHIPNKKVKVSNDHAMALSERNSHSENRGVKKRPSSRGVGSCIFRLAVEMCFSKRRSI